MLCVIDAGGQMNEIESEVAGEVAMIHVQNGTRVGGAALFEIRGKKTIWAASGRIGEEGRTTGSYLQQEGSPDDGYIGPVGNGSGFPFQGLRRTP